MRQKRGFIFAISIVLLLISIVYTSAEDSIFCVSVNGCTWELSSTCTAINGHVYTSADLENCLQGCCCEASVPSNNRFKIQCRGAFTPNPSLTTQFTDEECAQQCIVAPPTTIPEVPTGTTEPSPPIGQELPTPAAPSYMDYCGNSQVELWEECDGSKDTQAEGAKSDCLGQCGSPISDHPCRCPVTCTQDPSPAILQSAVPVAGQKRIILTWRFPVTNCQANFVYVQRCAGICAANDSWQQISYPLLVNTFTDTNFNYDTRYSYRIAAYYEKGANFADTKYSNVIIVEGINEYCVDTESSAGYFCDGTYKSRCNPNNQIIHDIDCAQQPSGVCVGGNCVIQGVCGECMVPFGTFFNPNCAYRSVCYQDYSRYNVDIYNQCAGVSSCYDYRSEGACGDNVCGMPSGCEWSDTQLFEIGVGVCRPSNAIFQDCTRCNQLSNRLLGGCDEQICGLIGDNCMYTNQKTCIDEKYSACAYYSTQEECTGADDQALVIDIQKSTIVTNGTHKIITPSEDENELGQCRWTNDQIINHCVKDSDMDGRKDCTDQDYRCQADILPPQTYIPQISVSQKNVQIPYSVFDNTYSGSDIQTYFSLEKTWTYPTIRAQNNKFSKTIVDTDFYILTYYSRDKANNLEEVQSLRIFIDGVSPTVTVTYDYIPQEIASDVWRSKVDVTIKAQDNADPSVTCTATLKEGTKIYYAPDQLENALITQAIVHYSNVSDGHPILHYDCRDKAGNRKTGDVLFEISGDRSLTNPLPNTAINYHTNVPISITSAKRATCKYSENFNLYEYMESEFSNSADGLSHTAMVNVDPLRIHHRFYVKCKLGDSDAIIGGVDDEIRFTLDEKAPITTLDGLSSNCAANWMHEPFNLLFNCYDPAQRKQGFPNEFGCSKSYYCEGAGCSSFVEARSKSITQTTQISYYSVDAGGNTETKKTDTIKIDQNRPSVSVLLFDASTNPPTPVFNNEISRSSTIPYIVRITSSSPLERIISFGFGMESDIYDLPKPYPTKSDRTEWQTLFVPTDFANLLTMAQFQINAEAEHGWKITELGNSRFSINTMQAQEQTSLSTAGSLNIAGIFSSENGTIDAVRETKDGRPLYRLNNTELVIKGSVSNLNSFAYYTGAQRVEVPLVNNQFEIPLTLLSQSGAEIETYLYFVGTDTQDKPFGYPVSFIIDKQPPVLYDFELRNAVGVMIRTPLPSIVADFGENVKIESYGIVGFDNAVDIQNLDNKQYVFNVKDPLTNGCYKLFISASDSAGNAPVVPYEIAFGVSAPETRIILENPHHGVAQSTNFDVTVSTTQAANCQYSFTQEAFNGSLLLNFDSTGKLNHTKKGFSITQEQPFYVVCDDGAKLVKQAFMLKVDSKAPTISSAKADPVILSQQPLQTKLVVETDEELTLCKYSKSTSNYALMRYFPLEAYENPESYKKIHLLPLSFTDMTPRSESYYVQCEDVSGRKSEMKTITYEIKDVALYIDVQSPPRYTSEQYLDLNFTTNKDALCRYKNLSSWVDLETQPRKIHDRPLGRYNIGTYTLDLDCNSLVGLKGTLAKPEVAELTYTFTIDKTKPIIMSINAGNYSCPEDDEFEMGILFDAYDNESTVVSYNYSIVDQKGGVILSGQESKFAQTTVNNLKFNSGEKYKVVANVLNGAGLPSDMKESGLVLAKNSTDVECQERNPPTISFMVSTVTNGVAVMIDCDDESGCDANSFKYGLAADSTCSANNPYTSEVELQESMFFCGSACDSLNNCVTKQEKIDVLVGDSDGDKVVDPKDRCPETPLGEQVDEEGCSESQRNVDSDGDSVPDQLDQCPDTPQGSVVDMQGCPKIAARQQQPTIIVEPTSIFSWILLSLGILAVIGGGAFVFYTQYYLPNLPQVSKPVYPEREYRQAPRAPIPLVKRPTIEQWVGIKKGENVFQALEHATGGKVFDKLANIAKHGEKDVFSMLDRSTKSLPRRNAGISSKQLFDQLSRVTSLRRAVKPEHPIEDLKKSVYKKKPGAKK
jgi:hypothetical protein